MNILTPGERIEDLIKKNGGSVTGDAEKIGTSQCTLSDFINGKRNSIRSDTLKKLCEYYDVSADYILGLSESASRNEDIQDMCHFTGLSSNLIAKCNVDLITDSHSIQDFLSAFGTNDNINEFVSAIIKYYQFTMSPHKCLCDIDGKILEIEMKSILKSHITDMFWKIIDEEAAEIGKHQED